MLGRSIFLLGIVLIVNNLGAMDLSKQQAELEPEAFSTELWETQAAMDGEMAEHAQADQKRQALFVELEDLQKTDAYLRERQRFVVEPEEFEEILKQAKTSEEIVQIIFDVILRENASFAEILFPRQDKDEAHEGQDAIDSFMQPLWNVHRKFKQAVSVLHHKTVHALSVHDKKAYKDFIRFNECIRTLETSLRECEEKLKTLSPGYITSKNIKYVIIPIIALAIISNFVGAKLLMDNLIVSPSVGVPIFLGSLFGEAVLSGGFWIVGENRLKKKEKKLVREVSAMKESSVSLLAAMCELLHLVKLLKMRSWLSLNQRLEQLLLQQKLLKIVIRHMSNAMGRRLDS